MLLVLPPASFKEKTVNVTSEFWFFSYLCRRIHVIQQLEFVVQFVNCDSFLPGIILKTSSDKSLREEETTHPEYFRCSSLNPLSQKFDSIGKIFNPTSQRLQTQKSNISPYFSNLIVKNTITQFLQILTHHNQTFQSLLQTTQRCFHNWYQSVVPDQFLNQNSVHWFTVISWIFLHYFLDAEHFWSFCLDSLHYLVNRIFSVFAWWWTGSGLNCQNRLKKWKSLVLECCYFRIVVQPKYLRRRIQRKTFNIAHKLV